MEKKKWVGNRFLIVRPMAVLTILWSVTHTVLLTKVMVV